MSTHININNDADLPDNQAVIDWYEQLADTLLESNQRLIINLRGDRDWCLTNLPAEELFGHHCVLSNLQDMETAIPFNKAETLLGQETGLVVYDGFSGINIDVFCMAAGLVKSGGVLILLTPQSPQQFDDNYGQWQGCKNTNNFFLHYLYEQLEQGMLIINQRDANLLPDIKPLEFSAPPQFLDNLTHQQKSVSQKLNSWLDDKNKQLFVLTADRGRGKSTLLGYFAQQHLEDYKIVVTAASKAQVKILFNQLSDDEQNVQFLAPDEIIRRNENIHLLIIDEAAMLPGSVLKQCIRLSDKTLIATTTGGYEGTGQGFLVKFMTELDERKFTHCELVEAIRWGQQDEMEKWMSRVLMLKPNSQDKQSIITGLTVQQISKQQLHEDKGMLKELYSLLVSAHYRTRPSDLRQIMEDDNQLILAAKSDSGVVGVLLLNREGGFDEELCHDVFMGKRRPQGHLFAQMITAQAGAKNFARYKGLRVQRLAVNENCRKQGVGRCLIESAEKILRELNLDYLSSSFALDSSLAPFWVKMSFQLVHISSGKGKSTGRQTVAVIKTSDAQVNKVINSLSQKINNYLAVWLLTYCKTMLWSDVYALLEMLTVTGQLTSVDEDEVVAFSKDYRGFDLAQASLQKLLIDCLVKTKLSKPEIKLCIEKILLNKPWQCLTIQDAVNQGKKESLKKIRLSILKINEQR